MYSLYHIKGEKWGCSKELTVRLRNQGYTLNDVCEVIEILDIDEAADKERYLNIRDGYGWNESQDYRKVSIRRIGTKHKNETKEKLSKIKIGKLSNHFGYKHSEESKQKIKEKNSICILVNDLIFNSQTDAAEYIGVTKAAISFALKHSKRCKGYNIKLAK
jgi:hypothetical protein